MVNIKKRVITSCIAILLGIVSCSIYYISNDRYKDMKEQYYLPKIQHLEEIIENEKAWIMRNQGESGEIYLNYSQDSKKARDVNPYFACFACMGLLEGDTTEENRSSVASYLNWNIQKIVEEDGVVSNYTMHDNTLVIASKPDSVDSYLAVFLTLFSKYIDTGGTFESLSNWQSALDIAFHKLKELTTDGLTVVSPEYRVVYLMDNVEVYQSYASIISILSSKHPLMEQWEEHTSWLTYFRECRKEAQASILKSLWNKKESRYEIGLDNAGKPLKFHSMDIFYPDGISQVYPIAFEFNPKEEINSKQLYDTFCTNFSWEDMSITDAKFAWPVLAYISASVGDIERTEQYISTYETKYDVERNYPLHTGDSGWMIRACQKICNYYIEEQKSNLLYDYIQRLLS